MEEKKPLVSVLLPVQNSAGFLTESVESLLSQSYGNIEVIAVDDFSRDNSYKILKSLRKKDKRLRIYKNKKKYGLAVTLNRCVRRIKGEFIAFAGPFDINFKFRIKKQLEYLLNNPKAVAVGAQCVYLNKKGKRLGISSFPTSHDQIYHALFSTSTTQPVTLMLNNNLLPKDILKFRSQSYPFAYKEVLTKVLKFGELMNTAENLYYYRKLHADYIRNARSLFYSLRLLIKSVFLYQYRPSLSLFFKPINTATSAYALDIWTFNLRFWKQFVRLVSSKKPILQLPKLILKLSTFF